MTISDNHDNFWQFLTIWQFLTTLTISDNFNNSRDLWLLRHWLHFWQLRTWIHDTLCYFTIKGVLAMFFNIVQQPLFSTIMLRIFLKDCLKSSQTFVKFFLKKVYKSVGENTQFTQKKYNFTLIFWQFYCQKAFFVSILCCQNRIIQNLQHNILNMGLTPLRGAPSPFESVQKYRRFGTGGLSLLTSGRKRPWTSI